MTDRKRNSEGQKKHYPTHKPRPNSYEVVLEMGKWKVYFSRTDLKIAMCEALNYAVVKTKTEIAGYFITDWRIYLILSVGAHHAKKFLLALDHHAQILVEQRKIQYERRQGKKTHPVGLNLFKELHFSDYQLKNILLGEKITAPFYDFKFWRMHRFLLNYNFCSVQNYHNCEGPVLVNSLGDDTDLVDLLLIIDPD